MAAILAQRIAALITQTKLFGFAANLFDGA